MGALTVTGLPEAVEAAIRARLAEPELEVVICGAGAPARGAFLELAQDDWQAAVAGASGAFFAAQEVVGRLLAASLPGRVVFVASTASLRPLHGAALEATVGGFLTTIAQVGAVELVASGITVNAVACGWLEGEDPPELVDGVPAGRLTSAEDVAAAIEFLASPGAGYVNGAVLAVDGGFWITKTGGGSPLATGG